MTSLITPITGAVTLIARARLDQPRRHRLPILVVRGRLLRGAGFGECQADDRGENADG
jgi:hypothetical protein